MSFFGVRIVIYKQKKMEPLPFETFCGSYQLIQELGRGASGICYHIATITDQRHYALKKIPLHLVDAKQFKAELTLLSSIDHPNLIRLRQSYLSKDFLYLVFDYKQERDLQKLIKEKERLNEYFDESAVWGYMRQMLEALSYLHSRKIIHRDIKPSNIFVNLSSRELQVGDLGTAKLAERENYTRVGTPLYLAPEIIKYESYSQKVDIWSLGVTIFQMAALRPPFQHPNFLKLAQSITYEQPQYPCCFSRRLIACLQKMLQKDPALRYSAQQLLQQFFINPVEILILPESMSPQQNHPTTTSRSIEKSQQQEEAQEEQQWGDVQLSCLHPPLESSRLSSNLNTHNRNSIEDEHLPASVLSIGRSSFKRMGSREDEIRQNSNSLSRTQLEESDDTIVLKVNPNDINSFCGYYKESPRPSRIYFAASEGNHAFKMGRKSSLFKRPTEQIQPQQSHFKTSNLFKENSSRIGVAVRTEPITSHRRQQSGIGIRQKHGELMSNLRPSQHGREQEGRELGRPQLIIIDLKPLLQPLTDI